MLYLPISIPYYIGSDEVTGFKIFNFQKKDLDQVQQDESDSDEDEDEPPAKKRRKETKSFFTTQAALIEIHAILPDKTKVVFWQNPKVNSIHGHMVLRAASEKEDKGTTAIP